MIDRYVNGPNKIPYHEPKSYVSFKSMKKQISVNKDRKRRIFFAQHHSETTPLSFYTLNVGNSALFNVHNGRKIEFFRFELRQEKTLQKVTLLLIWPCCKQPVNANVYESQNKSGCGVVIALSVDINSEIISTSKFNEFEHVWVKSQI